MFRQSMVYLFLSILVVVFASYFHLLIVYIDVFYTYINLKMSPVFSNSELGILSRSVISLVVLPLAIGAIPALVYWAVKGKPMPYFIQITWVLWFILVLSKILIH